MGVLTGSGWFWHSLHAAETTAFAILLSVPPNGTLSGDKDISLPELFELLKLGLGHSRPSFRLNRETVDWEPEWLPARATGQCRQNRIFGV